MLRANSPLSLSVSNDTGNQFAQAAWVRARSAPAPTDSPTKRAPKSGKASKKNTTLAGMTLLPEDFEPQINHVICGRGKKSYGHKGNQRFLAIVRRRVQDYADAATKHQKSDIVQAVVEEIEANGTGGFIRLDAKTGRYSVAEDGAGREKTSQALRDGLDNKYKSSKAIKRHNRKEKRLAKQSVHGGAQRRASTGSNSTTSTATKEFIKRTVSRNKDDAPKNRSNPKFDMSLNFLQHMPALSVPPFQPQPQWPVLPASAPSHVIKPCCGKRRAVSLDLSSSSCCDNFKLRSLSGNLEQYVSTERMLDFITTHNYAAAIEQDDTERTEEEDFDFEPLPLDQAEQPVTLEELEPLPITAQQVDALEGMEPFDLNIF